MYNKCDIKYYLNSIRIFGFSYYVKKLSIAEKIKSWEKHTFNFKVVLSPKLKEKHNFIKNKKWKQSYNAVYILDKI